jgi:Flp pilus assembly protein CpaB
MIVKLSLCVALVMLAFSAVPVSAHHGWGGNVDETSDLTGVVVASVSLAGPHATMKIRVGEQVWDMTLAPPAATERAGLKEGMIPVGATVTVHGNRNRDPKRFEMKCTRVTWNGKTYDVYPGRS